MTQPTVLLCVHVDGKVVMAFSATQKLEPAALSVLIVRHAKEHGLNVDMAVVPVYLPTAENITKFLSDCWDESEPNATTPAKQAQLFPPPTVYDR